MSYIQTSERGSSRGGIPRLGRGALGDTAPSTEGAPGAEGTEPVQEALQRLQVASDAQAEMLASLQRSAEETLFWRKVATWGTLAGALFAAIRLTDIVVAMRRRN